MSTSTGTIPANRHIQKWVKDMAAMCQPDDIFWCDGSEDEKEKLIEIAVKTGDLMPLNEKQLPGCYLHRSALNDVARTENLTFVCTEQKEEAGPNNNWMKPSESYDRLAKIFSGAMHKRTLYVIPFLMGPAGSPFSKVGIEITDSVYVVLNMRLMTRMGKIALDHLGDSDDFTRCLHSKADLDMERRFICHYPQDNTIWSVGSGYGGNALLAKKCLALRIASKLGQKEGWLAEHMLIVGVESPEGEITYVCGAFPSACGKTNLAMFGAATKHERLEDSYHRRRYFLVARGVGWPALGGQSGSGVLRRRTGHRLQDQPERHGDD
jgi:phosphoenolpyruvate carboxykinase (GTP)